MLKWEPHTKLDVGLAATYQMDRAAILHPEKGQTRGHRLMKRPAPSPVAKLLGSIPHRLQLAGGWIDQPFVSQHNPHPPGSMVVVQIGPDFSSDGPFRHRQRHARHRDENLERETARSFPGRSDPRTLRGGKPGQGRAERFAGHDRAGLSRRKPLDYDFRVQGGVFPSHIESCNSPKVARWLSRVLHLLPVEPRPEGYSPLGEKNLDPKWVARLGGPGRTASTPSAAWTCRRSVPPSI